MNISRFLFPLLLLLSLSATAQVRLPQLIADKMVIQRDKPIQIWGWASPGERIWLSFAGRHYKVRASADSTWLVKLPAMKAGGPYILDILASNHIVISDILIGDVWFCSGQSNMVLPMERVKEKYPDDIATANFPEIRNFFVPTAADVLAVHDDLPHSMWKEANPSNVLAFGAASFFFARDLYNKYHVPIGIINASVGGTPIQAWISKSGFAGLAGYTERMGKFKDLVAYEEFVAPFRNNGSNLSWFPDKGLSGSSKWYDTGYVASGWHSFWLPGYWADEGIKGLNGVVWFRREIDVPASMAGKPAKLFVGRIVDADETYLNGVRVGGITYQYPPRRYSIPAGLLKAGKNLLVVRVTNTAGKGGFVPDKRYELTDGTTHVDLRGDWQYKVGQVFLSRKSRWDSQPAFAAQNEPTGLYNTMVAPAIRYAVKGFLWYQGEANTGNPKEYQKLLPGLIADWRAKWQDGNLPFLYVQLPNFMEVQYSPTESQWAELRQAQLDALSVPNTAMAVTIDIGEWNDIHPLDKKDVGDRLALAAQRTAYGDSSVVGSGPVFQSLRYDGGRLILRFKNIGGGLMVKGGGELQQFAIAGMDSNYVWARARIEGDQVIVSSPDVPFPKFVRYAWADNPEGANLYNREGLPASPFEATFTADYTDDHDNMMKLLGIQKLRPGPSGNDNAPNHANYDTALANPYPNLPDLLTLNNGKKVTTADDWWHQRRPEVVEEFEREVYGRVPAHLPAIRWQTLRTERDSIGSFQVLAKQVEGHVDNSSFPDIDVNIEMTVVLPANARGPVPVLIMFGRSAFPIPLPHPSNSGPNTSSPAQQLIADGWGYVLLDPNSIQADNGNGLTKGIIGLVNKGQFRKPDDWGALRAWAWGAARALDYLEANEPMVDAKHVGIEGVSRFGKAALVTLAFETRFAMGLIGSSGEGGAKLHRRNWGEALESLTGGEYYWMAGNFLKYGASDASFGSKTANDLPVDSHELIALCAPRLCFISYGVPEKGDAKWLDHQGSYMAAVAAGSAYKLLDAKDLGVSNDYHTERMPPVNTGLLNGQLAWRQHDGGHTDAPNIGYFIAWADKNIGHAH